MRYRSTVFLAALLCAIPAFAQIAPPPVIQSVDPPSGSVAGGTLVTISGLHLSPSCGPYLISCEPVVRIGGKVIPQTRFTVHSRAPGMLHGRLVRPAVAGAIAQVPRGVLLGAGAAADGPAEPAR